MLLTLFIIFTTSAFAEEKEGVNLFELTGKYVENSNHYYITAVYRSNIKRDLSHIALQSFL